MHSTDSPVRDFIEQKYQPCYYGEGIEKPLSEIYQEMRKKLRVAAGPISRCMKKMGFKYTRRKSGVYFHVIIKNA